MCGPLAFRVEVMPVKRSSVYSGRARIDAILVNVSQRYRIPVVEILGRSRYATVSMARHESIYLARLLTALSYPELGRHFGRDHTSILSAYRRIRRLANEDGHYSQLLGDVLEKLGGLKC